jgi:nucleoside-diphosphate-sugar epimerase
MKVALIGSNSFIARNLAMALAAEGISLTRYSRLPPSPDLPGKWQRFSPPEWSPQLRDLLDADSVIYTAAAGVQRASTAVDDESMLYINASLPLQIASALSSHGWNGRWISFGSYFEIGEQSTCPASEEDVVNAQGPSPGPYCDTKRALTRSLAAQPWQMPLHHFILPTIYGANEDPLRLIPYVLGCLSSGTTPKLSSGLQVRQYLHISDLCRLLVLTLSNQIPPGILNAAPSESISVAELVRAIYAHAGQRSEPPFSSTATRDESMRFLALNPERIMSNTDWRALRTLRDGIHDYALSRL